MSPRRHFFPASPRSRRFFAGGGGLPGSLGCLLLGVALFFPDVPRAASGDAAAIRRGEYVFRATGGCGCHTDTKNDGPFLAGGRPIKTPFGTFFGTNITPDRETGIGAWSEAEFARAMTRGVAPGERHLFPVFPYAAFSGMKAGDLSDLFAYLGSVKPIQRPNRPHELLPGAGWRVGARAWKWLFFRPLPAPPPGSQVDPVGRGAYLANALGHCGECHTPRNLLGGLKRGLHFAGARDGPEGDPAPNITPDNRTGIGRWSETDLAWFLETATKPDGDDVQGLMELAISQGYKWISEADRRAIAAYLRSLPPIVNQIDKPRE